MSHYNVAVFTEHEDHAGFEVDRLLAPYYEGLEVEPYLDMARDQLIKFGYDLLSKRKDPPLLMDDEACYDAAIKYFDPEPDRVKEDGLWSTYNPESYWDWYSNGLCERVRDLDFEGDDDWKALPYAVVMPDGEWIAPGLVGWFGLSTESPEQWNTWSKEFNDRFWKPAAENDWWVTVINCHI